MAGGDLTTQIGFAPGTNFAAMGQETAILVVGCDLEEEAPVWWLRVKQAAERGATLIVLNPAPDQAGSGSPLITLRYPFGSAAGGGRWRWSMPSRRSAPTCPKRCRIWRATPSCKPRPKPLPKPRMRRPVRQRGMGLEETQALAQACANLLLATDHIGRPNNGLLGVWPRANDQGAWELGWKPAAESVWPRWQAAEALYIVAADPVSDDPAFQSVFGGQKFVVVQDLYLSQTARLADVVLPAQSWLEREGSYTSGERRVQRFYPALLATSLLCRHRWKSRAPGVPSLLTAMPAGFGRPTGRFCHPAP